MINPISIIGSKLPDEIKYNIQSYLVNETAYKMLQEYFNYLYYKKELYENFCYEQYIKPNCYCFRYFNSSANRWKTRDCHYCDNLEYSDKYKPLDFIECIINNDQFKKISEFSSNL
tara:strand:+ start:535 stop:882 length:348 start_codon:yes stop_codon:yes gene_type:complete